MFPMLAALYASPLVPLRLPRGATQPRRWPSSGRAHERPLTGRQRREARRPSRRRRITPEAVRRWCATGGTLSPAVARDVAAFSPRALDRILAAVRGAS